MNKLETMTKEEKLEALSLLQIYIESAVESEQETPADFKLETQHRINLVLVNLKEIFGLTDIA
jgi:hypothetical protein